MNFLSHFYFDRYNQNPYQVLGMVLPDLVKNADKKWNIYPEKNEYLFHKPEHLDLLIGWKRHLLVDKIFHSSHYFIYQQHHIKLMIREKIKGSPVKPFFLGHISLELLLDSLLITEKLINPHDFYNLLNKVNENILRDFLTMNGIKDSEKFFSFYSMFKKEKYLFSYERPDKIVYALKRICMRLWENPFNTEQEAALAQSLSIYKNTLSEDFMFIFDSIETQLN